MSHWKKSPFSLRSPSRTSWPIEIAATDPYRGEERSLSIASNELHKQRKPATSKTQFIALEKQFISQYQQLLTEEKTCVPLHKTLSALGISSTIRHESEAPFIAPNTLDNDFLSNIVEDLVPDIGVFANERVFGPMADDFWQYSSVAGAVMFFTPCMYKHYTPAGKICKKKPKFPPAINRAITSLAKTPTMLWQIEKAGTIKPLLPVANQFVPKTQVLGLPATKQMIARVLFTPQGPIACCVLPVSNIDPQPVYARLWLEWVRLKRHSDNIFWEDLLRYYGDLLYRNCCEQLFLHQES